MVFFKYLREQKPFVSGIHQSTSIFLLDMMVSLCQLDINKNHLESETSTEKISPLELSIKQPVGQILD